MAAAVGYLVFVGFGDWGGLNAPGLVEPGLPAYNGTHLADLLVAVAVGIATALVIAGVRRLAEGVARAPRLGTPALLLAGGLAVGVVAEVADVLGADSQDVLSARCSRPSSSASRWRPFPSSWFDVSPTLAVAVGAAAGMAAMTGCC